MAPSFARIERIVGGLPDAASSFKVKVIGRQMLGLTITPSRSDAAAMFILLTPGGAPTLFTGSGSHRNRFEFLRSDAPFEDELGAMVEAIIAGRIEDDQVVSRANRVIRQRTTVILADGRAIHEASIRHLWGWRTRHEITAYGAYT